MAALLAVLSLRLRFGVWDGLPVSMVEASRWQGCFGDCDGKSENPEV